MSTSFLQKIEIDCEKEKSACDYFLWTMKCPERYELTLTDTVTVYKGWVTNEIISSIAKDMKMSEEDIKVYADSAFTFNKYGDYQFVYSLNVKPAPMLTWKKFLQQDKIKVTLGSIPLILIENKLAVSSLLTFVAEEMMSNHKIINSLQEAELRLRKERKEALVQLEKAVACKCQIEEELFAKFVVLLNGKKEKLQELLQTCSIGNSIQDDRSASMQQMTAGNCDEIESDYNDTDEKNHVTRSNKQKFVGKNCAADGDFLDVAIPTSSSFRHRPKQHGRFVTSDEPSVSVPKIPKRASPESLNSAAQQSSEEVDTIDFMDNL
ncbi:uncharacterized protein LOC106467290 [Limulus polyphemus]|uniref:Uncharacterized protein LOC106467290 n=1 Tax=Limulus polyphemus TaxID=6850 RepID=A0ABM1BJ85_LIMPO|nr:uncharacterized protein LOC106467290 [Limulus polyphemus]